MSHLTATTTAKLLAPAEMSYRKGGGDYYSYEFGYEANGRRYTGRTGSSVQPKEAFPIWYNPANPQARAVGFAPTPASDFKLAAGLLLLPLLPLGFLISYIVSIRR